MTAPKKKPSACLMPALAFLAALVCLLAVTAAWAFFYLPVQAEKIFGPPAAGLSLRQRIYLSARLLAQNEALTRPLDPLGEERPFQVPLGESPLSVADRLQQEGLIGNAQAFRDYLVYSGLDTTLQAGNYNLSPRMTSLEIAHGLQDATPTEVVFSVLPGWRIEEVAAALPTSGLEIDPQAFIEAATHPAPDLPLVEELPSGASLEGFLFPGSYTLPRGAGVHALLSTLLQEFQDQVGSDLRQGFERQGLDLYQGVTLASIVEREAVVDEEMPLIASVFLNRLAAGEVLASDPTVQYAVGYAAQAQTWWKNPLTAADLKVASPYNTYQVAGLPPGPIAAPSLRALQAVAFPAQTHYFFFRAACDNSGRHVFSETYDQHIQKACP